MRTERADFAPLKSASVRDLCQAAIEAATAAGAEYADARVVLKRDQLVATKNGRVDRMTDAETEGIGVRVLVAGAWGFACDRRLTEDGARNAATRACTFARAAAGRHSRALAPLDARQGRHESAVEQDPFAVSLADKVDLCLRADAALQGGDVLVRQVMVRARREHKLLLSSEGTEVEQILTESGAGLDCSAARDGVFQMRSYPSAHVGSSSQAGWEYVEGLRLVDEAPRIAEQAAALVRADPCPSGVTDVVLDADQVALQVHESVGHPTGLGRVYGTEAPYAGTSFLKAGDRGPRRYGSEHMNIAADPTTPTGLGSFAFDDEGAPAAPRRGDAFVVEREAAEAGWRRRVGSDVHVLGPVPPRTAVAGLEEAGSRVRRLRTVNAAQPGWMPDALVDLQRDLVGVEHDVRDAARARIGAHERCSLLGDARRLVDEAQAFDVLPAGLRARADVRARVAAHLEDAVAGRRAVQ